MNYLTLENVTKSYGEKVLFQGIDLQISKGQKIALVAKNGTGKSTLLYVCAGREPAEGENSKTWMHKDIRLGFLEQEPEFGKGLTVMEAVFESENEIVLAVRNYREAMENPSDETAMQDAVSAMENLKAWDFEAKIKEILFRLNITRLDQIVDTLSGGQKKRLALAQLLIEAPEFLILDEPTNHLDLDMIEWLESYLQQPGITLLMVTHDRYFLERVCSHIIELDKGELYRYKGSYGDFLEKKFMRESQESISLDKNKKLLKRELEWVRRMPKARGTKAKSRVNSFFELKEEIAGKGVDKEIQIDIKGQRQGGKILELHNISKYFDDFCAVKDFSYKFKKKERVGIIGPNGSGKTTFLQLLTKGLRPDNGKVVVGGTTVFGYYTQTGLQLDEDKRVIDVVRDIAEFIPLEKGQKLYAPQVLERFLFDRKQQQVFVSKLSGGERRRLFLLTILMENPNFLILDEPTNDLDIVTLNVLEDFLMDFPGSIIIVSHDRYFMDKIVDHLFIFEGEGKIKDFNGTYTEYREAKKIADLEARRQEKESAPKKIKDKAKEEPSVRRLTYMERKEFGKLEKEIEKLETQKSEITEKFNNPDLTPQEIENLSIELGEVNKRIEEKEMRWMELAEFA